MSDHEHWQLDGSAPELYQRHLVPAITSIAADLIDRAIPKPREAALEGTTERSQKQMAPVAPSLVVTGTSSGIGYAIAALAIAQGWRVFGSVRKEADAARLTAEFGDSLTPLVFDVRDEAALAVAAKTVHASLGSATLNGLVNNAGIGLGGPVLHQPLDEFRAVLDTNILGTLLATRAFTPLLGADQTLSGRKGRIVNITSIAGKIGAPFAGAYVASKFAVEGLSEVMRRELKLYGIDVVVVAPGTVDTPIWDQSEGAIGRYAATDYGRAFDKGVRTIVRARHRHGLQAKDVAKTVMKALTARRARLRYAPAQHALMEQALPRLTPKRVTDFVIAHSLGLMPDQTKALRGVSV
jgi:NAD(P)-dependent dehydrogenase (short-subunit alcohol dehydrogenase family)